MYLARHFAASRRTMKWTAFDKIGSFREIPQKFCDFAMYLNIFSVIYI